MEKKKQLLNKKKKNLLEEIQLAVDELLEDEFVYLYRALEKLQRRLDALSEAFYRLCEEHSLRCD